MAHSLFAVRHSNTITFGVEGSCANSRFLFPVRPSKYRHATVARPSQARDARLSWRHQPEARCLRARCAADSIASGVNSSRDSTTSAASASASASGGYSRLGLAITTIPAAAAARKPFVESSTAAASAGSTASRHVLARARRRLRAGSTMTPAQLHY